MMQTVPSGPDMHVSLGSLARLHVAKAAPRSGVARTRLRQLALAFVFASQTKREGSPRALTGSAAQTGSLVDCAEAGDVVAMAQRSTRQGRARRSQVVGIGFHPCWPCWWGLGSYPGAAVDLRDHPSRCSRFEITLEARQPVSCSIRALERNVSIEGKGFAAYSAGKGYLTAGPFVARECADPAGRLQFLAEAAVW